MRDPARRARPSVASDGAPVDSGRGLGAADAPPLRALEGLAARGRRWGPRPTPAIQAGTARPYVPIVIARPEVSAIGKVAVGERSMKTPWA